MDFQVVDELCEQIDVEVGHVSADKMYDTDDVYETLSNAFPEPKIFPGLQAFQNETMMNTHQYINALKSHAYQHRLPLRAELLHLLNKDHEELYDDSEAEIMGLFPPQIHPDIYVSEIIESQRLIHQVLPGICRKLEMSEEEIRELIGKK